MPSCTSSFFQAPSILLTGGAPKDLEFLSCFPSIAVPALRHHCHSSSSKSSNAYQRHPSFPPVQSIPSNPSSPLNASDNGNCASTAKYPTWNSTDWVSEDCYIAVQQLFFREVLDHPVVPYEFVALGVASMRFPLDSQRTPRKYIFSKLIRPLRHLCCR